MTNKFLMCAVCAGTVLLCGNAAAAASKETPPPAVSIQEEKFEDLRPEAERAAFNNLKPLIEMVKHELFESGFSVKDERDMFAALQEMKKARAAGSMEGGDADLTLEVPAFFVRLKVLQYGWRAVAVGNVLSGGTTQQDSLHAQMTATVVDSRTGKLIGSANVKAGPVSVGTVRGAGMAQVGNYAEQMLQELNQMCARQIVAYLVQRTPAKFRPSGVTGKVLKVAEYGVLVKIDPEKVAVGCALDIFKTEKLDEDDEDEDAVVEEVYVGSVRVTEIKPKYVVCEPLTPSAKFEKKQLARLSMRFPSPANPMMVVPAAVQPAVVTPQSSVAAPF